MSERTVGRRTTVGTIAGWWWLLTILVVVGASIGYAVSTTMDSVYQASSTLIVGRPLTDPEVNQDSIDAGQRLAATYSDIVDRQPVLQEAAKQVGLTEPWQTLRDQVDASILGGESPLIEIEVQASSPTLATSLSNAINERLIALSPTSTTFVNVVNVEAFVATRLEGIQQDIAKLEEQVASLRSQLDSDPVLQAQIRRHINANEARILSLQNNYASMLGFVTGRGASNVIEVLEQPTASDDPVAPNVVTVVMAGALVGLLIGLAVASVRDRRSAPTVDLRPYAKGKRSPYPEYPTGWDASASDDPDPQGESAARFAYGPGRSSRGGDRR